MRRIYKRVQKEILKIPLLYTKFKEFLLSKIKINKIIINKTKILKILDKKENVKIIIIIICAENMSKYVKYRKAKKKKMKKKKVQPKYFH